MGVAPVFGTEAEQAFADKQVADRHATAVEVWRVAAYFDFRPLQLGSGHPRFSEAMDMHVDLLVAEIPLKDEFDQDLPQPFGGPVGEQEDFVPVTEEEFRAKALCILLCGLSTAQSRVKSLCDTYTSEITRRQTAASQELALSAQEAKYARIKEERQTKEDKVKREREEKLSKDGSPTFTEGDVEKFIQTVFEQFGYKQKKNLLPNAMLLTKLYDVVRNGKLPVTQALHPNSMKPMMHPMTNEFIPYSETFVQHRGPTGEAMFVQGEAVTGVKGGGKEPHWPTDTIVDGYKRSVMWGKGLGLVSGVIMTGPEVLPARGGGRFFVMPQGITTYSETLFNCGSARGMTNYFF